MENPKYSKISSAWSKSLTNLFLFFLSPPLTSVKCYMYLRVFSIFFSSKWTIDRFVKLSLHLKSYYLKIKCLGHYTISLWPSKMSIKVDSCWLLSSSLFFSAHTVVISYRSANCLCLCAILLAHIAVAVQCRQGWSLPTSFTWKEVKFQ